MNYSASPTLDADRHLERADSEEHRRQVAEAHYRKEIIETLTKTVRTVPHQRLSLPKAGAHRVESEPLQDVVTDQVCYGSPRDALMAALSSSDCPLVQRLRESIAASYADSNADWIAEVSL